MHILTNIDSLKQFVDRYKIEKKRIGFVPTMGALHEGHLSLVKTELQLSTLGGLVGVVFFVKFSESVLKLYFRFFPFKPNTKKKKGFKRAFAIKVARKYGLFGIALITPIFLSIPLGTFLALHFYFCRISLLANDSTLIEAFTNGSQMYEVVFIATNGQTVFTPPIP
ncbi:pantoate--beta-alanine ligase [bacterium]|nr:pantoate--beta-alanine ligase [bacterium]